MKESIAEADALPRTFSPKQRETTTGLAGPTNKPFRQEPAHWGRRAMVLLDPFFPHLVSFTHSFYFPLLTAVHRTKLKAFRSKPCSSLELRLLQIIVFCQQGIH